MFRVEGLGFGGRERNLVFLGRELLVFGLFDGRGVAYEGDGLNESIFVLVIVCFLY